MLRRLKTAEINGKRILNLPDRTVEVVTCSFDEDERAFYQALAEKTALTMSKVSFPRPISSSSRDLRAHYKPFVVYEIGYRHEQLYLDPDHAAAIKTRFACISLLPFQSHPAYMPTLFTFYSSIACDHPVLVSKSFTSDPDALLPVPPSATAAVATKQDTDAADDLADLFGTLGVTLAKCSICSSTIPADAEDQTYCSDGCATLARKAREKSAESGIGGLPPSSSKIREIRKILRDVEARADGEEKTISKSGSGFATRRS
jgi:SNF2 family DNA or RNA helicase